MVWILGFLSLILGILAAKARKDATYWGAFLAFVILTCPVAFIFLRSWL